MTVQDRQRAQPRAEESSNRGSRGRWLSIKEACVLLGVDQSTLRRWSDSGRVPVFRTPGGHRRYNEDDLRALVNASGRRHERPRVTRQELTDRSLSAFEEGFWQGARQRKWFIAFSPNRHEELRQLGRRLVDLAVRYAASPESADRGSLLDEGRQIGRQYGVSGARAGLTSTEAVEAFLYFRSPVVKSVVGLVDEQGLAATRAVRVFVDIGHFMDQVLLSMVSGHEAFAAANGLVIAELPANTEAGAVGDD